MFVAGDSDYVPLAQRCKRLGRYVVGIGVAGSTSGALVSACNEFIDYAELPGVTPPPRHGRARAKKTAAKKAAAKKATAKKATAKQAGRRRVARRRPRRPTCWCARSGSACRRATTTGSTAGGVKSQMQRMDPAFNEKSLGFSTFRAFVESRADDVESKVDANGQMLVRLPDAGA